jgi:hypothetical protein
MLARSQGVRGIYRLAAHSVADLDAALARPVDPATPVFGGPTRARRPTREATDALFWQSFRTNREA